jgi:hypothetical protein
MQEAVYALCRLHDLPGEDNAFYQSPAVEQWIGWGFEYWTSLQHKNGAFDEAYPFEQCLAATAFTTFYLGNAYLRWRERLTPALQSRIEATFRRAGQWLCANDETHGLLSNHLGVAVAALECMAQICQEPDFSVRSRFFLERIFQHQSPEGWMKEYDGADIGYGTHGFFYLAVYWQMTGCEQTLDALRRFARFLTYFIHPDGTLGGEYSSRNTEFYYPGGFEILASYCPASAAIATYMRDSLASRQVCGLWSMDAFNFMPMLNNLFFAMDAASEFEQIEPLPWQESPFEKYFPQSGLWVVNRDRYYAIIGLSKGGTVSVFDKVTRRITARHAGLIAQWRGNAYTSQDYQLSPAVVWETDRQAVKLVVPWKLLKLPVFTSLLFIAFRIFTLTLGRFPTVSRWVKQLLVKVLIRRKSRPPIEHIRQLRLTEVGVEIDDRLQLPSGMVGLQSLEQFTSVHMGSSMYCDIRSVGSSAGLVEFKGTGEVRLHGFLGLENATWQETKL